MCVLLCFPSITFDFISMNMNYNYVMSWSNTLPKMLLGFLLYFINSRLPLCLQLRIMSHYYNTNSFVWCCFLRYHDIIFRLRLLSKYILIEIELHHWILHTYLFLPPSSQQYFSEITVKNCHIFYIFQDLLISWWHFITLCIYYIFCILISSCK